MSKATEYTDKLMRCADCAETFTWEAGEQAFFMAKVPPLQPPKRCPDCRRRRRATIQQPPRNDGGHPADRYEPAWRWDDLNPSSRGRPWPR